MALYNVKAGPGGVWLTRVETDPVVRCRMLAERPYGATHRALMRRGMTLDQLAAHALMIDTDPERVPVVANG